MLYSLVIEEFTLIAIIALSILVGVLACAFFLYVKKTQNSNPQSASVTVAGGMSKNVMVEDDSELIAVITAAISAMYESEQTVVPPFKVKNIKLKY